MPRKGVITLSELVLLSVVWRACDNAWKFVIIEGLNVAVRSSFAGLHPYYCNVVVGLCLVAVLYSLVLLTRNVNVGRYKVFELTDV